MLLSNVQSSVKTRRRINLCRARVPNKFNIDLVGQKVRKKILNEQKTVKRILKKQNNVPIQKK